MKPGRFISYWFLYMGVFSVGIAVRGLWTDFFWPLVPALLVPGLLFVATGMYRIRNSEEAEATPEEYGLATSAAALILVGLTMFLAVTAL